MDNRLSPEIVEKTDEMEVGRLPFLSTWQTSRETIARREQDKNTVLERNCCPRPLMHKFDLPVNSANPIACGMCMIPTERPASKSPKIYS